MKFSHLTFPRFVRKSSLKIYRVRVEVLRAIFFTEKYSKSIFKNEANYSFLSEFCPELTKLRYAR